MGNIGRRPVQTMIANSTTRKSLSDVAGSCRGLVREFAAFESVVPKEYHYRELNRGELDPLWRTW